MKRILFMLLAFTVVFASCKKEKVRENDEYLGLWEVSYIEMESYGLNSDELLKEDVLVLEEGDLLFRFKEDKTFQLLGEYSDVEEVGTFVRVDNKTINLNLNFDMFEEEEDGEVEIIKSVFKVTSDERGELILEAKSYEEEERIVVKYFMNKK